MKIGVLVTPSYDKEENVYVFDIELEPDTIDLSTLIPERVVRKPEELMGMTPTKFSQMIAKDVIGSIELVLETIKGDSNVNSSMENRPGKIERASGEKEKITGEVEKN